jgi:hypothetical protein
LLVIGAGGGFNQVLVQSGVGAAVADMARGSAASPLVLAWTIAALIRVATGSATVAMTTAAGIVAPIAIATPGSHPELLVLATGAGSLVLSHVNDSGFWLIKEFFNMTVLQTLQTWTVAETIIGTHDNQQPSQSIRLTANEGRLVRPRRQHPWPVVERHDEELVFRREQLQEEASGARAEPSGTLRIDMPVAFGRLVMTSADSTCTMLSAARSPISRPLYSAGPPSPTAARSDRFACAARCSGRDAPVMTRTRSPSRSSVEATLSVSPSMIFCGLYGGMFADTFRLHAVPP